MAAAITLPMAMFWFGWTSGRGVHWMSPIVAGGLFNFATFLILQVAFNYLPACYPRYVASILAGNDFFRSITGAAFPLFSTAFFHKLGVGPACSLIGGVTLVMLPIPFAL